MLKQDKVRRAQPGWWKWGGEEEIKTVSRKTKTGFLSYGEGRACLVLDLH